MGFALIRGHENSYFKQVKPLFSYIIIRSAWLFYYRYANQILLEGKREIEHDFFVSEKASIIMSMFATSGHLYRLQRKLKCTKCTTYR